MSGSSSEISRSPHEASSGGANTIAIVGNAPAMKSERIRKLRWMLLALLVIGLSACGGQDTPQAGNLWDSGRFDQSTWQ
jgi:hypothetical protein